MTPVITKSCQVNKDNMEDTSDNQSSRKLPPISPRSLPLTKPPRSTSKGKVNESFTKSPPLKEKPIPSPRRNSRQLPPLQASNESISETATKKKKKKKIDSQSSSGETLQTEQDINNGSQTSVVPKKRKKKKKQEEMQLSSTLLNYLGGMEEDVVENKEPADEMVQPVKNAIITSQPVDKLFIETKRSFKTEVKSKLTADKTKEKLKLEQYGDGFVTLPQTSLEFAIKTHRMWQTFCLFFHGLTAGIGLWQVVIVYIFEYNHQQEFVESYKIMALPVQSLFYGLLVICLVSACDRYDISNINKQFMLDAVTLKSGALSVVIYFICIVMHVSVVHIDDKMFLYNMTSLFNNTQEFSEDLATWKIINLLRGVAVILGWLLLSIFPNTDRLVENLSESVGDILGPHTRTQNISTIS
ncbi:Hypothetical predicted protein [Octopus vulgaris]|uniref:Transmembrane protein 237 n=2 Tax=Octopus TaxID=6643 RepID=A0AA36F6S7_OCTVU|nr:Hypothetical predicted protein [Octopus vulgaris]